MPLSQGVVGALFQASTCKQLQSALDLLHFITKEDPEFNLLDLEMLITSCIVAVPSSGHCNARVIYNLGTGAVVSGIKENELKSSFLALTGEQVFGETMPSVMTLPTSVMKKQTFKIPSETKFEEERLLSQGKTTGWFKAGDLRKEANLPLVMPVPVFLILDAFHSDIDALVLYERWLAVKNKVVDSEGLTEYFNALTAFIAAILTSNQDISIKIKQSAFVQAPNPAAINWKKI